jgi:uncharacterized RDD family membrane protein YckC
MPDPTVLRLPPAPHGRRVLAVAIDVGLTFLLAILVTFLMIVATRSSQPVGTGAAFVVLVSAGLLVHLFAPLRWQATPGMRIAGLKIVAEEDQPPLPQQTGLRGAMATMTVVFLLPIPFQILCSLLDPDRRSVSDWISGTRVVLDPEREAA